MTSDHAIFTTAMALFGHDGKNNFIKKVLLDAFKRKWEIFMPFRMVQIVLLPYLRFAMLSYSYMKYRRTDENGFLSMSQAV